MSDTVKVECVGMAVRPLHVLVDICNGCVHCVHLVSLEVRKLYVTQIHVSSKDIPTGRCQVVTSLCCQQVALLHITEKANVTLCTAGIQLIYLLLIIIDDVIFFIFLLFIRLIYDFFCNK